MSFVIELWRLCLAPYVSLQCPSRAFTVLLFIMKNWLMTEFFLNFFSYSLELHSAPNSFSCIFSNGSLICRDQANIIYLPTYLPTNPHQCCPSKMYQYLNLVYTKLVNSVFRAFWLTTQARDILHYPLVCKTQRTRARVITFPAEFWPDKIHFFFRWLFTGLVYTNTIIHLSVVINIHHFSPPLR